MICRKVHIYIYIGFAPPVQRGEAKCFSFGVKMVMNYDVVAGALR